MSLAGYVTSMALFKKKIVPSMTRQESLDMIPLRNMEARTEVRENGLVLITYEVAVRPWFGKLASKVGMWDGRPMTKQLELDEIGSFVWSLFDDARTVREVVDLFMERYKVQRREATLSVTEFIRMLGQRGLIGLR